MKEVNGKCRRSRRCGSKLLLLPCPFASRSPCSLLFEELECFLTGDRCRIKFFPERRIRFSISHIRTKSSGFHQDLPAPHGICPKFLNRFRHLLSLRGCLLDNFFSLFESYFYWIHIRRESDGHCSPS